MNNSRFDAIAREIANPQSSRRRVLHSMLAAAVALSVGTLDSMFDANAKTGKKNEKKRKGFRPECRSDVECNFVELECEPIACFFAHITCRNGRCVRRANCDGASQSDAIACEGLCVRATCSVPPCDGVDIGDTECRGGSLFCARRTCNGGGQLP